MARSNGQTQDMDDVEDRQLRSSAASAALTDASQGGSFERDVLEYLAETDLPPESKRLLRSLLSRDFPFANLNDAEFTELKWELRHIKDLFYERHPSRECLVTGEIRAAINDDPHDTIRPLTEDDILETEQFFRVVRLRLSRAKRMKQQELLRTSIAQTEVNRPPSEDKGGIWGKIRS